MTWIKPDPYRSKITVEAHCEPGRLLRVKCSDGQVFHLSGGQWEWFLVKGTESLSVNEVPESEGEQ